MVTGRSIGFSLVMAGLIFVSYPAAAGVKGKLSLEDLKNYTITSVSKRPESSFDVASAIYVITAEDIRRVGAINLPDALRLAPGLQVNQIDSNKWSVTSRGFPSNYSNKILVLIDGRTVYSPVFSGVLWDVQDVVLEDIKRIEVIRGPGATLWGANAVNGVINIITKRAAETQGNMVSSTYGNAHVGFTGTGRYGGKINDKTYYRVYAKTFDKGADKRVNDTNAIDGWKQQRTGFRVDWEDDGRDYVTFEGDIFYSNKDRATVATSLTPVEVVDTDNTGGGDIISRWTRKHDNNGEAVLQIYYDNERRDHILLNRITETYDVDFQDSFDFNDRNQFVWGLGYRHQVTRFKDTESYDFTFEKYNDNLYSAFLQNKYAVIPDKLFLIAGSKFEHNDFTGFEVQPNIRLSWLQSDTRTLWASISRAVRTPSIAENDISTVVGTSPGTGGLQKNIGNRNVDSEDMLAYEVGYRMRPRGDLFFDVTGFYNDYENLISAEPYFIRMPDVIIPIANNGTGEAYGVEMTSTWDVNDAWRLIAGYTFFTMDLHVDTTSDAAEGRSPKNQFSLRSHYNLPHNLEFDNMLYYVDNLSTIRDVPAFIRFDTRLGWKTPVRGLEVSIVGQNLFDNSHREFTKTSNTTDSPPEVGRTVYGRIAWEF